MNNRNVLALHIIYHNLSDRCFSHKIPVPKEEEVASLEGGLHGARKDDDDGRGGVGDDGETFPHLVQVSES